MIAKLDQRHALFVRYVIAGIAMNLFGYCLYLLFTTLGLSPKTTMSMLYFIGIGLGFVSNRKWAFKHQGKISTSFMKYIFAHLIGYGINYALLDTFAYKLGYPHQLVQAAAVMTVAMYLFIAFKYIVFPEEEK